jgi:hypothetical protein
MPPKPCPQRLQRLIDRANEGSPDELRALRGIARELEAKLRATVAVTFPSRLTIDLDDYSITITNELKTALGEIDPVEAINLIRECPVCQRIFWAGRDDKVACSKHVEVWRKRRNRPQEKERRKEADRRHRKEELRETLSSMTPTAIAVIRAVGLHNSRYFYEIDWWVDNDFREIGERSPTTLAVRQTTKPLVREKYLEHSPNPMKSKEDYYTARPKLIKLWGEMVEFGLEEIPKKRPTH